MGITELKPLYDLYEPRNKLKCGLFFVRFCLFHKKGIITHHAPRGDPMNDNA